MCLVNALLHSPTVINCHVGVQATGCQQVQWKLSPISLCISSASANTRLRPCGQHCSSALAKADAVALPLAVASQNDSVSVLQAQQQSSIVRAVPWRLPVTQPVALRCPAQTGDGCHGGTSVLVRMYLIAATWRHLQVCALPAADQLKGVAPVPGLLQQATHARLPHAILLLQHPQNVCTVSTPPCRTAKHAC